MKSFVASCLFAAALTAAAHAGTSDLPLIASEELGAAGGTLVVEGLADNDARKTSLAIANFGDSAARCSVNLTTADGQPTGELSTLEVPPRSDRYLYSALAGLGGLAGVRAAVSCDQPFYAFAVIIDGSSRIREVTIVDPGPPAKAATPCAPGSRALCFDAKGIVHQPTAATPVKRFAFALPPGVYSRVKMSLDVTVGDWYPEDPDGKHLIYWFVLNKNFNMLGMLYFRGPAAYTALSRYGIGLTHPKKLKLVKPFKALPGHTYRVENDLDMAGGVINVTITDKATGEVVKLRGVANVSQLTAKTGNRLIVDMGFPENKVPDEVPSFGWTYRDIHIEAVPK